MHPTELDVRYGGPARSCSGRCWRAPIPPLLAASLVASYNSYAVGIMLAVYAALAAVAVLLLSETRGTAFRFCRDPEDSPAEVRVRS